MHAPSSSYGLFGYDLEDVRKLLHPQVVAEHASWFKVGPNHRRPRPPGPLHEPRADAMPRGGGGGGGRSGGAIEFVMHARMQVNGDMNAYLYTSSRAMHSEILNLLLPQVTLPHFHAAMPWSAVKLSLS